MPTNTKQQLCIKPTGFLVYIFGQFSNFINCGLIDNDLCHSKSRHAFYHHIYLAHSFIYHFNSLMAISFPESAIAVTLEYYVSYEFYR